MFTVIALSNSKAKTFNIHSWIIRLLGIDKKVLRLKLNVFPVKTCVVVVRHNCSKEHIKHKAASDQE